MLTSLAMTHAPSPRVGSALWYVAPRTPRIAPQPLPQPDAEREVLIEALYSGMSRGTERLVFHGRVPPSEHQRMRAPFQEGAFTFPIKYGYASVGRVAEGPADLRGRQVFCLYPHQSAYVVPREAVLALPADVPAGRAVLAANMETALNAVWDAELGPGDTVAVIGAGVVGCLVAYLSSRHPGTQVTLVDIDGRRGAVAARLGVGFARPDDAPREVDLVFHASGHPAGLGTALEIAGDEAHIIELSWYGDALATLALGGAFHAKRLTIRSSQVGKLPSARRARWTLRRRLELALALLRDEALDALISSECAFAALPGELSTLLGEQSCELMKRVVY